MKTLFPHQLRGELKSNLKRLLMVVIAFSAIHPALARDTNGSKSEANSDFLQTRGRSFYELVLRQHREVGEKFKSGDTNTPLLILEWFVNSHYVQSCRVRRDGLASWGDYGQGGNAHGRGGIKLDAVQQGSLIETMNELPPAPSSTPHHRWLLVSGLRSNRWFTEIYDRANIPAKVEKLFEITHAQLRWIVGEVASSTNIDGRYRDTWVNLLETAKEAPIAVSSSAVASGRQSNSIQLWDTRNWRELMIPAVEEFTTWAWSAAALSADGQSVALGAKGVRVVDVSTGKIRWDVRDDGRLIKQLAFVQDDKQLAVSFQNAVEIWDSLTGQRLAFLVTNEMKLDLLKASRNGRLLAVGSGNKKIQIWDLEKREIVREAVDDPRWIRAIEFSPDAKYLAISGDPYRDSFVIWDLETGNKTAIPARGAEYFDEIVSLAWSPDGEVFAAEPQGRAVLIFDVRTWKPITRWQLPAVGSGTSLAFAADGTLLARLKDGSLRGLTASSIKNLREHSNYQE